MQGSKSDGASTGPSPRRWKVRPWSRLIARPMAVSTVRTRRLTPEGVAIDGIAMPQHVHGKDAVLVKATLFAQLDDRVR